MATTGGTLSTYGLYQSRRNTTYEHRGSSSLSPRQFMEQDMLSRCITLAFNRAMEYLLTLTFLRAIVIRLRLACSELGASRAAFYARQGIERIRKIVDQLVFLNMWIMAIAEMAHLYVEDLTVFTRRRVRFGPKRNRTIDDISDEDCYTWFGIAERDDMRLLICHLRITDKVFRTPTGAMYTGEECFLIYLYHVIKGMPFTEMARYVFGGDPRRLSDANKLFINYGYNTFYNKISGTSLNQWLPSHLNLCRDLIWRDLNDGVIEEIVYENGVAVDRTWIMHNFDFDSFRVFGFLDDFGMPTARPGDTARRRWGFIDDIQRAFYSGYFRRHGLKAQVVFLPIGLIGSVYIAALRHNDTGVLNMSRLNQELFEIFTSGVPFAMGYLVGNLLPCLYCDGIFPLLATIVPRFVNPSPDQSLQNLIFASQRQCMEHVFGDHRNRFHLFSVPHRLRLFNNGVTVRRECLLSFFILNCYYCIDGTRGGYFQQIPPSLEEYLPLHEVLHPPPAVDLGDTFNYWMPADEEAGYWGN